MSIESMFSEPPLQVLPSLARAVGLNEAIILQQLHSWLDPRLNKNLINGRLWVMNTYEKWHKQFPFWGEKTIRRTIANLEELGLLDSFITKDFKKTKLYSINYERLGQKIKGTEENSEERQEIVNSGANSNLEELASRDTAGQESIKNPPDACEEPPFNSMIAIWNELVQARLNLGSVQLNDKRKDLLRQFLGTVLASENREGKLEAWRRYCSLIANSRYLTGENPSGFRVTLDWALKPEKAIKILEGGIYDKPQQKPEGQPLTWQELEVFLRQHGAPHNPLTGEWVKICRKLASRIGLPAFKSWFIKTALVELSEEKVVIGVETHFQKTHLNTHYQRHMEQAIKAVYGYNPCIVFEVASSLPGERINLPDA